jgi:multidrug resistance efflux pump
VAQAELDLARARLERVSRESKKWELEQGQKNVDAAKTQLEQAEKQRSRQKQLAAEGLTSAADVEAGQSAVEEARAELEKAQNRLTLASSGIGESLVKEAQADLAKIATREQALHQECGELEKQIAALRLCAKADGTLAGIFIKEGQAVKEGELLAILAHGAGQCVRVKIPQDRIAQVTLGQEALVYGSGERYEEHGAISGRVKQLGQWPITDAKNEKPAYEIEVEIADAPFALPWGSIVDIRVKVGAQTPLGMAFGR